METSDQRIEREPGPKDISKEFLEMEWYEFDEFLQSLKEEPALSITIDWQDVSTARRLKAFLEDTSTLGKQERSATIRATEDQYNQELNVFASGVKWKEIQK